MADELGGGEANSGTSGAALEESKKEVTGGVDGGLESKTLMENPSDKGILSDEVRVPEETKVLVGESKTGSVISGSGWKVGGSGIVGINDLHDVSKQRAVQMKSCDNGWDTWGVMGMVERVLKRKFPMDDEEEDVNDHGNIANLVPDMNTWQGVIGEPSSVNGVDVNGTVINKDLPKLDSGSSGEGAGLNGSKDLVSNEMVPDGSLRTAEVNDVRADALIPMVRGEHYITEKEGEYYVSDLVWGKVRSHPWWPGQIFAPSAASDKAIKYFKRESYLIAFFGDQTFAWNEEPKIKPFRMHFSQMEKQSNADGFCHAVDCALDEVARRAELGLSCPCLPQDVHDKIKFQVVANAGIRGESSRRAGGDNSSSVASFSPGELLQFLGSLAETPRSKTDRLQFVTRKAQLLAFNRWKGHYQLPVIEECDGLLEDDYQLTVKGEGKDSMEVMENANDFPSKKRKSTSRGGSSRKRKHVSGDEEGPQIKEKQISVVMSSSSSSCLQSSEKKTMKRTGRKAISSGKNRDNVNSKVKRQKSLLSPSPSREMGKSFEVTGEIGGTLASNGAGESQRMEMISAEIPSPDVILSKLILAAKKPMQAHNDMISIVGLLRELRNSTCLERSSNGSAQNDEKREGKQPLNLETIDTFGFEGTKDSYWTDRIIQSYSQDQVLFEPETASQRAAKLEANTDVALNSDNNKEKDAVIVDLDAEKPSLPVNEVSEECSPTALILNFSNLESIPSIPNLNEIFSRYGPLKESETELLRKSKRAKVIFKRRKDAETAFSSTGKYSIFGPSLISYRLNYDPSPRKSRATSKRSEKTQSLKADAV